MTLHCMPSINVWVVTIVIFISSGSIIAAEIIDVRDLRLPDSSSSAIAGFYAISPDGKTTPIDPVKSGLATTGSAGFNAGQTDSAKDGKEQATEVTTNKRSGADKPRTVRIRISRRPPERSLADQFQCERHGLYYTNDGRCILPAYGHLPVFPHRLPSPGMPPMRMD